MQTVKVTKVYRGDVETQYGTKQKVGIKTETHGDKWLSCFQNQYNEKKLTAISEGQELDIIVTQKGDFLNFSLPTRTDYLEQRMSKVEAAVFGTGKAAETPTQPEKVADTNVDYPTGEETGADEDIPF